MLQQNLPIVNILFEGDFRLSILQALSIDRLYESSDLSSYLLILNGNDNVELEKSAKKELNRALGSGTRNLIDFVVWEDLLPGCQRVGYYDQQALKIAAAAATDNDLVLVLDSKNHFVTRCDSSVFFKDGLPCMPLVATNQMWKPYVENSLAAVGNTTADSNYMMPSVTPYVMYPKKVRDLRKHLEDRYSMDLPSALAASGGTEFLIYYAFIQSEMENLYARGQHPVRTLFTSWPQDPDLISQFIADCADRRYPMFGLHRNRIPQLSAEHREQIFAMWRQELLADWEQPSWFIEQR